MTPHNNPAKGFLIYPEDAPHLEALSPEQRDAITAIDIDGLKYAAAAERLIVPVGSVKSRVNRARSKVLKMREAAKEAAS